MPIIILLIKSIVRTYRFEKQIYHNTPWPHRSGRVQRESDVSPVKPAVNSPVNRAAYTR